MAKKILIVDDDASLLVLYKQALEAAGYEVTIFSNPVEALDSFQTATYDLILLDMIMPVADGMLMLSKIKEVPNAQNTPVIILTNFGSEDLISQTKQIGAADYLLKYQCTPDTIVQKVNEFLSGKSGIDK